MFWHTPLVPHNATAPDLSVVLNHEEDSNSPFYHFVAQCLSLYAACLEESGNLVTPAQLLHCIQSQGRNIFDHELHSEELKKYLSKLRQHPKEHYEVMMQRAGYAVLKVDRDIYNEWLAMKSKAEAEHSPDTANPAESK